MENRQNFSSSFANRGAILTFAALVLISSYFGLFSLAVFFMFLTLLFSVSYFWGQKALRGVEITLEAPKGSGFVGERIPGVFRIENRKFLPVIWLELSFPCGRQECVEPEEDFTREWQQDGAGEAAYPVWKRKFAWILWHQQLEWKTWFRAVRRGIFFLEELGAVSGDGFGLCIKRKMIKLWNPPVFVVYPRLQEVKPEPFLRQMYDADVGQQGIYEDPTLLKGIRDYRYGDPVKRINWRMLARQNQMQVNVYERVQPRSSFFLLDLASFSREEREGERQEVRRVCAKEELEDMLSVLGSLFVSLLERQMACGLALPHQEAGGSGEGTLLLPSCEEGFAHRLLSALAGVSYEGEQAYFDSGELLSRKRSLGQVYVAVESVETMTCQELLSRWGETGVTLLSGKEGKSSVWPVLPLSAVRREVAG